MFYEYSVCPGGILHHYVGNLCIINIDSPVPPLPYFHQQVANLPCTQLYIHYFYLFTTTIIICTH